MKSAAQRAAEELTSHAVKIGKEGWHGHADQLRIISADLLREDRERKAMRAAILAYAKEDAESFGDDWRILELARKLHRRDRG